MLYEPYASAEIAYRQGRLLAEAEDHRLRQQARQANKERRERVRRQAGPAGPGGGSRLRAAVVQLAPRSRRHERAESIHRAA